MLKLGYARAGLAYPFSFDHSVRKNPEPENDKYSGQFKLRIPKSLHKLLAEHSKREGISMNQYCMYLLSRNDALFGCGAGNVLMEENKYK